MPWPLLLGTLTPLFANAFGADATAIALTAVANGIYILLRMRAER